MIIRSSPARLTELLSPQAICVRCLRRLSRPTGQRGSSASLSTASPKDAVVGSGIAGGLFKKEYFLANGFIGRPGREARRGVLSYTAVGPGRKTAGSFEPDPHTAQETATTAAENGDPTLTTRPQTPRELPHRRKQRLRQEAGGVSTTAADDNPTIPLDASSRLSALSSTLPTHSVRRLLTTYLSLSKPRLTFLIVLTTTTAYSLYPVPALLLPSTTAAPSLSTLTLLFLTTGTTLSSASANALNMIFEPAHDAKMSRTRNRPLVRGLISPLSAYVFAFTTGLLGLSSLYLGVNPTVAFLSALNIGLYALVYTPMKRIHPVNTWVGALVGAIPPLMGWAAAAGQTATATGSWQELLLGPSAAGGWLLAGLLFAWQFPHFNALSWSIREEYKAAGYQMLAWTNPRRNARVALRYAVACAPLCVGLWWVGVTDAGFVATSGVANAWLVRQAWRFWRKGGGGGSARGLFWASVWHLPVVMVLAMGHKTGLWDGVWKRVVGEENEGEGSSGEDEEDDDDDDDDDDEAGGLPEPLPVPIVPGLVADRTTDRRGGRVETVRWSSRRA